MTLELELCQNKKGKPEIFAKALRVTRFIYLIKEDFWNASILKNILFEWKSSKYFLLKEITGIVELFIFRYSNEPNCSNKWTIITPQWICGSGKLGRGVSHPFFHACSDISIWWAFLEMAAGGLFGVTAVTKWLWGNSKSETGAVGALRQSVFVLRVTVHW